MLLVKSIILLELLILGKTGLSQFGDITSCFTFKAMGVIKELK